MRSCGEIKQLVIDIYKKWSKVHNCDNIFSVKVRVGHNISDLWVFKCSVTPFDVSEGVSLFILTEQQVDNVDQYWEQYMHIHAHLKLYEDYPDRYWIAPAAKELYIEEYPFYCFIKVVADGPIAHLLSDDKYARLFAKRMLKSYIYTRYAAPKGR